MILGSVEEEDEVLISDFLAEFPKELAVHCAVEGTLCEEEVLYSLVKGDGSTHAQVAVHDLVLVYKVTVEAGAEVPRLVDRSCEEDLV